VIEALILVKGSILVKGILFTDKMHCMVSKETSCMCL